ncbi:metallophosphatase family protein [Helicobacter jaachi]|uniref:Metallophosphatase family protein n=1 Tax=Helicobacter jaachi TaxID=1677920 RepID=A0A4U8TBP1_9HELI|nr:metallophosphoesterase [Helicobacter jaachi]TLD97329.1 metallophosphatase family protein [Helicobacter jaachi]
MKAQKATRFYIFGDTHGRTDIGKVFTPALLKKYRRNDYIVVCGDFGVIWCDEIDEREHAIMEKIKKLPCPLLFVDGNHENFNRFEKLPQVKKFNATAGEYIKNKSYHLKRGEIYEIAGKRFFTMGGALSIDKYRRTLNQSWWPQEAISDEELALGLKNIYNCAENIDYVITHTIPEILLHELFRHMNIHHKIHDENPKKLTQIFNALQEKKHDVKAWFFGHWHDDLKLSVPYLDRELTFYLSYNNVRILDIETGAITNQATDSYEYKMLEKYRLLGLT